MTTNLANKTSLRVPYQLPEFIRSDDNYQTFVAFIQAYYEWMEQNNIGSGKEGAIYGTQNLLNYQDIDFVEPGESFNKFIDYYINNFLPNFPIDTLADKSKLVKIARRLYEIKGTPASYQFLFRALYNSDADIFLTRDVVFKASDGKWYVSKSLRLATNDSQFLSIENFRLFGLTTKAFATVERSLRVGDRIEVYISNIERLFNSGETVRVVDNNNQPIYFKDGEVVSKDVVGAQMLEAKVIGSISSVQLKGTKRGSLYNGRTETYSGDPVVFYGGLNSDTGIGAKAFVYETTAGSIRDIQVVEGSHGYREDPNTYIQFVGGGGRGAVANVATLDQTKEIVVGYLPTDQISLSVNTRLDALAYGFFGANTSANQYCTLANAFTFTGFSTYPIVSVVINSGGSGYKTVPSVRARALYDTNVPGQVSYLSAMGILGPIDIITPGQNYANGDIVYFTGAAGVGANAVVTVNGTGSIVSANYVYSNSSGGIVTAPLGGMGYRSTHLPTLTVGGSGTGAQLRVATILGDGAQLTPIPDERGIGAITSFIVENYGEDYISAPSVSLRVRDLVVTNVSLSNLVKAGEQVYQGANLSSAVFKANVDSVVLLEPGASVETSKYVLRVYNYTSNTKTNLQFNVTDRASGPNIHLDLVTTYNTIDPETGDYLFNQGIRTYGNGAAEATAKFLNGLIVGQGQYLKDDGFPSSNQVLENENYNNFTYNLTVQKSFSAYRELLFKLLHPSGTKVVPIYALKSQEEVPDNTESFQANSQPLSYYTEDVSSLGSMYSSFNNPSNNIVKFTNTNGVDLTTFINVGSTLELTQNYGPNVLSKVISVDDTSNTAVLEGNVFLSFANVAVANVISSNNRINILSMTGQYDLINNGEYSNTENELYDIAFVGDKIKVVSGVNTFTGTITYVSYSNNVIFADSTLSFSSNSALVSIGRDISTTDVRIYNSFETVY